MEPAPYGPFPYSAIIDREALSWPDGAHVALLVVPNIEFFPLNIPVPGGTPGVPDVSAWGRRDYGNRVGVFRMMDAMAGHGVRGTVALNSLVCDYVPRVAERCLELDWELMGHSETNAIRLGDLGSEDEAAACIRRTLDRIEAFSGARPRGWLGAGRQQTWTTLDVIADEGCLYTFDWDNDDQPVPMDAGGRTIVSMPYGAGVSDLQCFNRDKRSAAEFEAVIRDAFDVLYREAVESGSGRVVAISLHPYIIGLPHRIGALERGLGYICGHAGVWRATGLEVARHVLAAGP
ncbi:MAG: polysaccharide deacetylase [Alphaproteobacteria bacterium]|nr:polysaccharide deacetylase [Alphaproteobacteria bacterium]